MNNFKTILAAVFIFISPSVAFAVTLTETATEINKKNGIGYFVSITGFNGHLVEVQYENSTGWHNYDKLSSKVDFVDSFTMIGDSVRFKVTGGTGPLEYTLGESRASVRVKNRPEDFYLDLAGGNLSGYSLVHKFGAAEIGTTVVPISMEVNDYPTPLAPVALELLSSDAADTAGGVGAQSVTIIGLDASYNETSATYITAGTTPVPCGSWNRVYRAFVATSGTYSSASSGSSHVGAITIREAGAGDPWASISITPTAAGQSQIGVYSVPVGKSAYLLSKTIAVDSIKSADVFFFHRSNIDDVTAPFTGIRRMVEREIGISGVISIIFRTPKGPFVGPCDIGFMAKVGSGTADVSVEFELVIVDN